MNPRWNTKAATTVLLGSLLLGSGAPAMSAASSSTAPSTSGTVQALSVAPSTTSTTASHSTTPAAPAAPVSTAAQETGEKRGWIRPVIDWIKRNVPAAWNSLTSWGARSWNNFVAWWNGLASWVRWTIDTLWTGTVWELYVALRDFIF